MFSSSSSKAARVIAWTVAFLCGFGLYKVVHALFGLFDGAPATSEAQRLFRYPLLAAAHFVSAGVWTILVPFQLWTGSRNRFPRWHRLSGRITIAAAAVVPVSGILLVFAMPQRPVSERAVMTWVSLIFGFFLLKAVLALRARNFIAHREWMIRMTAAGLAPMTQRILFPFFAALGIHSLAEFWDLFVTAAWVAGAINIFIGEWWLSRAPEFNRQYARAPEREKLNHREHNAAWAATRAED